MQRPSPRFRSAILLKQDIRGNVLPKFIADVFGEAMLETKASVTEFCHKNVSLSLEELKNIKIKLFFTTKTVHIAKLPKIRHFLTNMTALSAVMLMQRHAKA